MGEFEEDFIGALGLMAQAALGVALFFAVGLGLVMLGVWAVSLFR